MRPTIKSLTLDLTNAKAEIENLQGQLRDAQEIIKEFQAAQESEQYDTEESSPLCLLWELLNITEPTNHLWDELVVRVVNKGFNCYFPKSFYDTDKELCQKFLGKLMRHAHGQKKKAWFAPDYLAIRNG